MKNKIIKFICLVSLLFSIQSLANPINKIDFVGLNVISNNTLMAILPVKIGDQYNQNTSDEIIQTLFNTGYFSDISVSSNDDNLTITLVENPYIKYFNVDTDSSSGWSNWLNNEKEFLDSATLNEFIESNQLSAGNIYTKSKLVDFISSLKAEFNAAGYYSAQIESNVEIDVQTQSIDKPLNSCTTKDRHQLLRLEKLQFLTNYYNSNGAPEHNTSLLSSPLPPQLTEQKQQIVTILDGFDIKARFLNREELAACSTFPRKYFSGSELKLSNKAAVKMIGNAVPPEWAKKLIQHNIEAIKVYKSKSTKDISTIATSFRDRAMG